MRKHDGVEQMYYGTGASEVTDSVNTNALIAVQFSEDILYLLFGDREGTARRVYF